uniref:SAM pointed domain containing ETS transcription factor n=1 Tax=Callorhinchus milii TaxID=7868 RepID=A0A4W3JSL2_CALMI
MGSAGRRPSMLQQNRLAFEDSIMTNLEKGNQQPKGQEWTLVQPSSAPPTPERTLPVYLSYFDMLLTEDCTWLSKGLAERPEIDHGLKTEQQKEPEQCPIVDSQEICVPTELDYQNGVHLEERSLEQVQTMVVGEVLKEIETACKLLNIAADPMEWGVGNVQKWILWTEHQYRLPQIGKSFQELSGKDLCSMSEEEFRQRSPVCGDILYAHLDIWKSAAWMKEKTCPGDSRYNGNTLLSTAAPAGCADEGWMDTEADSSCSGQPIHLWQFLKELLLKPHSYGRFIRWLNKEKGQCSGCQGAEPGLGLRGGGGGGGLNTICVPRAFGSWRFFN